MTTRKIIVVPCIVNSWLYISADTTWPFGPCSCMRMITASSAADGEQGERGEEVERADPLVVDGGEPAPDPVLAICTRVRRMTG